MFDDFNYVYIILLLTFCNYYIINVTKGGAAFLSPVLGHHKRCQGETSSNRLHSKMTFCRLPHSAHNIALFVLLACLPCLLFIHFIVCDAFFYCSSRLLLTFSRVWNCHLNFYCNRCVAPMLQVALENWSFFCVCILNHELLRRSKSVKLKNVDV